MEDRFAVKVLIAFCVVSLGATGFWIYSRVTPAATAPPVATKAEPPAKTETEVLREMVAFDYVEDSIEGTVKNTHPSKTMRLAHLTFGLYDEAGNRVGTASELITELRPGETWKFSTRASAKDAVSAKLIGFKVR